MDEQKKKIKKRTMVKLEQLQYYLRQQKNITFRQVFDIIDSFVSEWFDIEAEIERQEWTKRLNAKRT